MTSIPRRTEPHFGPPPVDAVGAAQAETLRRPPLWPWLATAGLASAMALSSALAVPLRPLVGASAGPQPQMRTAAANPVTPAPPDDEIVTGALPVRPMPVPQRAFAVRVAGGDSADGLWGHLSDLKARFPGVMAEVPAAVRPVPSPGSKARYELLAGPYRNAAEAAMLCGRLRAHDIVCAVRDVEDPAASRHL